MRVFSALISSFVFTSAVFEHPKLFVWAQPSRFQIGEWAGTWQEIPNIFIHDHSFFSVWGRFEVPSHMPANIVENKYGTFVGVGIGGNQFAYPDCGIRCDESCDASISVGVLIHISKGRSTYGVAYQAFPGSMTEITGVEVEAGDDFIIFIYAARPGGALVMIRNQTRDWTKFRNVETPAGHTLCMHIVDWKVGTVVVDGQLLYFALPIGSIVTINRAQAMTTSGTVVSAADFTSLIRDVRIGTPRIFLKPITHQDNEDRLQVERVRLREQLQEHTELL